MLLKVLLLTILVFLPTLSEARMSEAQYAVLANDITVTNAGEFSALVAAADYPAIAAAYNLAPVTDCWCWKTALTAREMYESTSVDSTVWSWTTFIGRSQAERDAWIEIVHLGVVNPSLDNLRQGIADIFSGAGGATQRTHLLAMARRKANRIEKLLSTSGSCSTGTPSKFGYEGTVDNRDISHALTGAPLP